jgi:prepilin-type N-terminal cleavage/methylation domain-containing protein
MTRGRARRGFTLIEVLVAVIILLTGVVLALRIFPRGFDSFLETQQVQTSNKLLEDMAREFKEHPDTLPDGIYPLDADSANAGTAAGYFDFADLHAIDYRGGAGAVFTWLNAHRSPMVVTRVAAPATASLVVTVENTTLLQTGTVVTVWSAGQPVQATVQGVDPTALQLTLNVPVTVEAGDAITVPRWPLWQPVSVRAPRRIEGEKVTIPADVSQEKIGTVVSSTTNATDIVLTVQLLNPNAVLADMVTPGMQVMIENQVVDPAAPNRLVKVTSVTNPDTVRVANDGSVIKDGAPILVAVNFIPSYLPRFGPVQLPGHIIIDPDTLEYTSDDICIYDLRYRRVTRDELDILSDKDTELPNTFYYAIDYAKHMLYVLPNKNDRYVRISYYYQDAVTGELLYHVAGQAFIKKGAYQVDYLQATATPPDKPFDRTAPQGVVLVQGSEQINRAYVAKAYHSTANPYTLQSGEYYYDTSNPYLLGAICFAAADRGRKVKMDYVTADWGILHEDLTVDNTGTVGLGLPDPKIANRPTFPREAATWTLYGPMRAGNGVLDPVLALVDVRTGMRYDVVSRANIRGGDRATPYGVVANSGVAVPNQVIGVDLRDAERGRVKLGGLPGDVSGDWRGVWDTGVAYAIDDLTQCNGLVFRCIRNHVSAPISLPDGGP